METKRKIEILLDVKWRLENIFCHFTDDIDDSLDNQFNAWSDFVPQIERWMEEFTPAELDTDSVALFLMDFLYDEIDRIHERILSDFKENGEKVWGLAAEISNEKWFNLCVWKEDWEYICHKENLCESLSMCYELLKKHGVEILDPPRWKGV